ncbi:MAG: D-cysteine desulfhydrase family protein [Chloroflexi bacterium]|nr:D-cysteine desulfhydrase family protein [Chloroflexota bacterium]
MDIHALPRFPLATLPTPLDELPRLSQTLGVRVLMKRDDLTGLALGGNKARKLEFLVADALQKKADVLVTGGGVQSNHIRTTAAAARKAGLDVVGVFFSSPSGGEINGNLLLDEILGARLVYANANINDTERAIQAVCDELRAAGRKPYLIPVGGSTKLGCLAYMLAFQELQEQLRAQKIQPDAMVITTGSCGTHAGILAGVKFFHADIPVHGVTVSRPVEECRARITRLVKETAQFVEHALPLDDADIIVHGEYVGEAYAKITPAARSAIFQLAQLEGIFLDPVYTGKTMAGLIDLVQRRVLKQNATVVFWHTGGIPGLFAFPDDVLGK